MKIIPITLITVLSLPLLAAPPGGKARGKGVNLRGIGGAPIEERAAMREEAVLDHLDTHKWKADPEATDKRPENLGEYLNRTYQRIVRLLHHGSITEKDGLAFKMTHTDIVAEGKSMRAEGELTKEQQTEIRGQLDELNDSMNASLKDAEEGAERSPLLNRVQHRFDEQIEFGERSGRLSKAEATRLKRQVAKLAEIEEKAKEGGLSTREREKLFEEAKEIARELRQQLLD